MHAVPESHTVSNPTRSDGPHLDHREAPRPNRHDPAKDEHVLDMSAEELAGALDDVRPTGSLDRTDTQWFRTAVFYEVLVRSFKDSNGDGIGDFKGLESKLDYLQWLGVDCLWLPPFYDSPLRDGGYDISDYRWIREELGTIEDFKTFLDAAHDRGLRVIIDFVMNHTSDSHPWFQASRSDPDGPFGNFYVWSDTDEKYSDARIIFLDTEKSNWKWDEERGQYYWHRFFHHQPDLNFDEPRVIDEMFNAVRFWMDMGIDGFRLDAVPYLVEEDGTNCENLSGTHEILKDLRAMVDREYPGRILLCEANQWPDDVVEYFGAGDECQMAFHFPVMPRLFMALRQHSRMSISDILARTPQIPDGCQWGTFLRNHDELTLEMVTAQEREYLWDQYAPEDRMRCNLGIRRRLATLVGNDQDQIRLLHAMLLALPGSPVLYYGDEIGMGDDPWLPDRDGVRTPMQWDNSPSAGFSDAPPEKFHLPVIDQFGYRPARVNVERQMEDPSSQLVWLRSMLAVRRRYPVFGTGEFIDLGGDDEAILAFLRRDRASTILCLANLSPDERRYVGVLPQFGGHRVVNMLRDEPFGPLDPAGTVEYDLAGWGFAWILLHHEEDH